MPIALTYSVKFDGVNDLINCGSHSSARPSTAFTWAAWRKRGTPAEGMSLISFPKGSSPWHDIELRYESIKVNVGGVIYTASGGDVSTGVWRHSCGTWDGSDLRFYDNGVEVDSVSVSGTAANSGTALVLGNWHAAHPNDVSAFFGWLIDPRTYNWALSPTEVLMLAQGIEPSTIGRLGYWAFSEGSGTTAANSGTATANGTLTNGPIWTTDLPTFLTPANRSPRRRRTQQMLGGVL